MAEIDTSKSQAPLYTPSSTDLDVQGETQTVGKSSVIQKNGDVITDTQSAYVGSADAPSTGAAYNTDASLPKLANPSDSRIQVGSAQARDTGSTDSDSDTAPAKDTSDGKTASANGEEPKLFIDVQDPGKKGSDSGTGQGKGEGEASAQGAGTGAQVQGEKGIPGQIVAGQTAGVQGSQGSQASTPLSGSSGPSIADLQQFNPELPNSDPYAPDPLSQFTDAAAILFGTNYLLGEADASAGAAGNGGQVEGDTSTPTPLAGDPNSSVLPDGTVIVVDGEQVVVDASKAGDLKGPIIDVSGAEGDIIIPNAGTDAAKIAMSDPAAANLRTLKSLEGSLLSMTDIIKNAEELAKQLPPSAETATFLNFLKSVSQNLLALSNMLYELQMINTNQSRQATQAQKDAAINDIKERAKAEQDRLKAESKKRKKAKFGVLNKIFSFIKVIFMAVAVALLQMIPGLGQIASAYVVAAMVDEVCKTFGINYSCTQALTNAIGDAVVGMMPYLSDAAKESVRTAVKGVCAGMCIAAMFLSPVSFALGGGAAIQASLIDSGLIKDEGLKAKFGMALGVAQAVAGIILAIVMSLLPGGQGAAFGALSNAIGTTTAKMADTLVKIMNVTMAAVTITGQVNTAMIASLNQQIAKIRGAYESSQALVQMLIQLLKQAIKTLQDGIKEFASQIAGIQGSLQANYSNLSAQLGALYNAT